MAALLRSWASTLDSRRHTQPWLARHESTARSTSCSASILIKNRAGLSQHAHVRPRTPSWTRMCVLAVVLEGPMRLGPSNPPKTAKTIGISWHLMASAGRSSGRPPGPQSGLAKQAKQHQAAAIGPPTGGALLPLLPLLRAPAPAPAPLFKFLGLPAKPFVSFSAVPAGRRAALAGSPVSCRSVANPLQLELLLFSFASRVETVGRCQCRCPCLSLTRD